MKRRWTGTLRSIAQKDGPLAALTSLVEWAATRLGLVGRLAFRELSRMEAEERFDETHGTDTEGLIHAMELGLSTREHFGYCPMPKEQFDWALDTCGIDREQFSRFVFVDLGSGKGRALLRAAAYPFSGIVGVEISEDLHRIAERNAEIFRTRHPSAPRLELVNSDAAKYRFPAEDLLVLLMNQSFGGSVLAQVVEELARAGREHGREIIIAISGPRRIAVLERSGDFALRAETHNGLRKIFTYAGPRAPAQ